MEKLSAIRSTNLSSFEEALASAEATLRHLNGERERLVKRLEENKEASRVAKNTHESIDAARRYLMRGVGTQADLDHSRNLHHRANEAIKSITKEISARDQDIARVQSDVSVLRELVSHSDPKQSDR